MLTCLLFTEQSDVDIARLGAAYRAQAQGRKASGKRKSKYTWMKGADTQPCSSPACNLHVQ